MFELSIERTFPVSVEKLFNAWTQVETIKQWFAPGNMTVPEADADLKPGGQYRIVMEDEDGSQHIVGGQYKEIKPNERLVFSWQWEGSPNTTHVEVHFQKVDEENASLRLVHNEFIDQEACDKHNQGWQGCLANLEKV